MTLCRPPPPLLRLLVPLVMLVPVMVTAAGADEEPSLCMTDQPEFVSRNLDWFGKALDIRLQVSDQPESHLVAWVFKLFLKEIYGYSNTSLIVMPDRFSMNDYLAAFSDCPRNDTKCQVTRCDSVHFKPPCRLPDVLINLQAWTPASFDLSSWSEMSVLHVGRLGPSARIGWFLQERITNSSSSILDHWRAFRRPSTAEAFNYTEAECDQLKPFLWRGDRYNCDDFRCQDGLFIPDTCRGIHCAVLLASTSEYSGYAIDMIVKYQLKVKVFWVGDHLEDIVKQRTDDNKPVLFAHYSPSRLALYAPYAEVAFPPCSNSSLCHMSDRYLQKLAWRWIKGPAGTAYKMLENFHLSQRQFEELLSLHARHPNLDPGTTACLWMRRNNVTLIREWLGGTRPINTIYLGGIFPITGNSYQDPGVVPAVMMAVDAINKNKTLLQHFHLELLIENGGCSADVVMKAFINYLRLSSKFPQMAGVLGPACSNTLEPIVGVARHFKVVVISFSAEGVLMTNRTQYPYFFRTIGENRQFRFVYKELLKQLQFKRVASLSESGQKYSEYISLVHDMLQESGVTFVSNRNFPSESNNMAPYLKDLREQNARIIIADMYQEAARAIMCEAYRQNMTAKEGYLWFLPEWFTGGWYNTPAFASSAKCTTDQVMQALDGHLALAHADFTSDDSMMQDNMTVGKWKELYKAACAKAKFERSKYASYAYDATWTYALALDKLLREQPSRHQNLHRESTVNRMMELLNATDFHGVSGRLRFHGPSRVSVTEIKQWRRDGAEFGYHVVGRFFPNFDIPEGGRLELDESKIRWLTPGGHRPVDGSSPPCDLQPLADLLGIDCQGALIIVNVVGLLSVIVIFVICVLFYKRRYERKMQRLRDMGLGNWVICSPEWEVKRDKIVMNRKLGEGAFGTVYGGEALLSRESREKSETANKKRAQSTYTPEEEWCSVAVKTLKLNSTMEEKRDFLSEAELMKKFEHVNIIQLLGVCTHSEPILTVMEFMLYGDLKTFLLARRNPKDECGEISDKKLTSMARDVACALSYLADRKFVHRDVACRNCLVGANYVVKLADFGMTRSMCENNYYKFHREGMLPVRWMAPESLAEGIFTPMSDIWSYGVLLFEITTFGGFPFQGFSNGQVLDRVRSGKHVEIPPGVKPELAELLKTCWSTDPDDRPEARRLVELLGLQYPRLISPCLDVPLSVVQLDGPEGKQTAGRHCSLTLSGRPRPAAHRATSCEKPEPAEARYLLARPPSPLEPPSPPPSPPSETAADANGYATKYVVLDHRSVSVGNDRNITL